MSTGEEYWIIRNSWASTWGAAGYVYMAINSDDDITGGTCGILGKSSGNPPVFPFKTSSAVSSSGAGQSSVLSTVSAHLAASFILLWCISWQFVAWLALLQDTKLVHLSTMSDRHTRNRAFLRSACTAHQQVCLHCAVVTADCIALQLMVK